MNKTGNNEIPLTQRIMVDTNGLMALCSCGMQTATEIGNKAGAKVKVGKRTLWKVSIVKKYLEEL